MKLARSQNAVRNMRMGLISKIVNMLLPFLVRAVFIRTLGAEYLGVNGLFSSVLSVLSLAELGFGSAIVFNMYKAIAEDDEAAINALLYFYRKVYRCVGAIILGLGLLMIPILPHLTKGSYPGDINPTVVYLVFLLNTVLSYFLFAYLGSLMSAFQRNDVSSRIGMVVNIGMNLAQIALLVTVRNYYAYLAIMPLFTILSNIRTAVVAKRMFPQYRPFGRLNAAVTGSIKEKVGGLAISKVCQVSRNAFDSIFVSIFLGLTKIAIYNNYYMIMSSITGFFGILTSAMIAGAGNSVAMETQEKNHRDMMRINFVYMWISGWCTICLLCLYQQFMGIWAGKDLLLPMSSVVLFCLYFYTLKLGDVRSIYVDAAGIWWQLRFRALAEAFMNIALNWILGKAFGINGIIAATLISLFLINYCYGSQLIYRHYFTQFRVRQYFTFHAKVTAVTAAVCAVTYLACRFLPMTLPFFFVRGIICVLLPNILYFVIYRRTSMYREAMPWMLERVGIQKSSRLYRALV